MIVKTYQAAAALAVAAAVGFAVASTGPSGGAAPVVHALAVPAAQLAGPCAGAPQLDAQTLALFFAPAVDEGAPSPAAIVDESTFTLAVGPSVYTVELADDGAGVTGPDASTAALLAHHVNLCVGNETMTAGDGPGRWTPRGEYLPANDPAFATD